MNNKEKITIISSVEEETLEQQIKLQKDEKIIKMNTYSLSNLNIKELQDNNIIIEKIILLIENPTVLSEIIRKKLNVRCNSTQASIYQKTKITHAITVAKKNKINYELKSIIYNEPIKQL